ncbi:hypothetical protein C0995_016299 [Termitomyces sp. Mi166|nr:hypothetical protein C0995_016299 [Termitomyces sp. Mi166\
MSQIPIESPAGLNTRFELLRPKICQTETEDSWEAIYKNLKSLVDLCQNGGACEFSTELVTIIRSISRPITNSLITERTRLSSVAVDLISVLATGLGKSFKPLLQIFLPTLLSLCGRTNKVIVTRAKACIMVITETTQLSSILSYFVQSIEDKSASIRLAAAEGTLTCVNCFNPPDLEKDARASEVETIIQAAAKDAQADIRVVGRKLFEAYKLLLPKRVESFTFPLSPTTKKYLDIKSTFNAQLETSQGGAPHRKNQLSSSTSALSSTRGRTESAHPVVHARSASSSTLPIDGRVKPIMTRTKTPAISLRQKTEMLPPALIPIRPSKVVSVTRSTTAAEIRPRVVSTTLPSRAGETTTTESNQPHGLPVRPNSATSHCEVTQRLHPQSSTPTMSGPSGPRRVPISGVEKNSRPQAPVVRARVVSNPNWAFQSNAKVPINRAPQMPAREQPKVAVKMRGAQPLASSRPPTSTTTSKPPKTSGVTQPTQSQISRAKATAEQKETSANASKPRWGRTAAKGASSSISSQRGPGKGGLKTTVTGIKKPVQPATIPLPPSPSPIQSSLSKEGEELLSLAQAPVMMLQAEIAAAPAKPTQNEEDTPFLVSQSPQDVDDETDTKERAVQHDQEKESSYQETTEWPVEDHSRPLEGPTTPTLPPTDNGLDANAKTPISSLLASIQRGFMYTPSSPLSPPQSYANRGVDAAIPYMLGMDGSQTDENAKEVTKPKPFMFGIGEDHGRSMLGSVENLDLHK